MNIDKILLLKLDHLGDFIMSLRAIEHLRGAFPVAELTIICGSWNSRMAADCGLFDKVITYDYFPQNAAGWNGRPVQSLNEFKRTLNGPYDIAIDMRPNEDTRHLLQYVDASLRCGFGTRDRFPYLDIVLMHEFENRNTASDDAGAFPIYFRPGHFSSKYMMKSTFSLDIDFSITNTHIVWGPYYALPKGAYRATFGIEALKFEGGRAGHLHLDVARDLGKSVAHRRISFAELAKSPVMEVELAFENPQTDMAHEFRIYSSGGQAPQALKFRGVKLDRVGDERVSTWRSSQLHKGEHMFLLACLIAERLTAPALKAKPFATPRMEAPRRLPAGVNIAIAPFSNSRLRDWPLESYAKLTQLLVAQTHHNVVLLGAPDQADKVTEIMAKVDQTRVHNLAGQTAWSDMPSVLCEANLLVCNNSGLAHMAGALGVATLAIYSGSHEPSEWGPRGERVRTLTAAVPCAPCGIDDLSACKADHLCMRSITPEFVLDQIRSMLRLHGAK